MAGREDFEKEAAEFAAMAKEREAMIAREASFQQEMAKSNRLESESARVSKVRAAAKREAVDVDNRAARSAGNAAKATQADTAAIEANTKARERANRKATASKAIYGAQSPQFAQAHALMEGGEAPSQYRLRQIPGVGQRRAAAMQLALQQGIRPSEGGAAGAMGQVEAAHHALAASEYRLAQANDEYTRVKRKGTQEEAQAAYVARERLKAERQSAQALLQTAESESAARAANSPFEGRAAAQQAMRERKLREERLLKEIDVREEAAYQAYQARVNAGRDFAEMRGLPAPGQTVQGMPVHLAQTRTAVPIPATPAQSGYVPDWIHGDPDAAAKMQAESIRAGAAAYLQQAEAAARAFEAQGRLNEAADIYEHDLNNPGRAQALAYSQQAIDLQGKHAAAMGRSAKATREAAVSFFPLSQAMHRHGALTSEFISAAARGEVTLKEMGNQAVITAGKFGGWTVAATGVYAVAGALGQVAEGAIKASSGTDQAYRVITEGQDPDALQKSFGSLSKQFNVPIDTAADAVYRMGQVFHNQTDAVKAAQASLYSYKTGEVDVATSTKNLIAIQRAFGLSSDNLVGIFDQINQAQNTFGIAIGDTESGLAKAGGTWKQAGGDLSYLLAMFVAIQKATGRGGEEIGTALSRLYYVQHPEAAEKLKAQGVDVNLRDAQSTFKSAISQAQKPGADIQAIASGLLGNQYARLFTAVLSNPKTLNDALKKTSPEASEGSAYKELQKVLGQVDEQIESIANHFQRLGEAMARAGAFNFAGVLLKTLTGVLSIAEGLVNVFNLLPSPLREGVTMMAQLAVGLALVRRLGATEGLANTPFGFLADPVGRGRTHTIAGLREAQAQAFNRVERFGQINVDKAFEHDVKRDQVDKYEPTFESVKHLDPEDERRKKVESRWFDLNDQAARAEGDLAISTRRLDSAREIAVRSQDDLTTAQKTSKRKFEALAASRQWPSPRSLDQPNMSGIQIAGMLPGGTSAGGKIDDAAVATRRAARSTEVIRGKTAALAASIELMSMSGSRLGTTGRALSRTTQAAGAGLAKGAGFIENAAASLGTMRGSMVGLAAALGPLDIALLAVGVGVAADAMVSGFEKELEGLEKYASRADRGGNAQDIDKLKSKAKAIQRRAAGDSQSARFYVPGNTELLDPVGLYNRLRDKESRSDELARLNETFNPVSWVKQAPSYLRGEHSTPQERRALANQQILEAAQEQRVRERLQDKQLAAGKPRPQLTAEQLIGDIKRDGELRKNNLISLAEFDKLMDNHLVEQKTILNPNKERLEKIRQELAAANRAAGGAGYNASLRAMPAGEFAKEQQGTGAAIELYGLTDHNMDYARRQYKAAEEKWRNSSDPDALAALNTARNAYFAAIIGETNKELQAELLSARSETQRRAAFARAAQQYKEAEIGVKDQDQDRLNQQALKDVQKNPDDYKLKKRHSTGTSKPRSLEDQLKAAKDDPDRYGLTDRDSLEGQLKQATDNPDRYKVESRETRKERARRLGKRKRDLDKDIARQNRDLTLAELQLKQQSYEDRQQGREILLNLQLAGTADPMRQAALRVEEARRQVNDASAHWGENSRQYRQALTELRNAYTQQAQSILSGVQADNSILLAQAGDDPVQQAAVAAGNAHRELDAMLKNRKKFDPNQIKQQRASVIDAERAARNARIQQQQDLTRLQGELEAARAGGDPVAIANAAIRAARAAQKNARTDVEKLQALVDLANANNQLQEAIAERESARYDLLKSQTDDPVEQARLDLEEAKKGLKGAKGLNKIKKQTEYNNALKAYKDSKVSATEDTINFEYQMERITADEAAKQLEALANMKGISKAKKRELLLQAKQLRDEASGDYELDVGSIRLPSLYEVRRFVQGGAPNASQVVTDNRNFTVNISTPEAATAFGKQLEITNGTSAKAAARSMMMR